MEVEEVLFSFPSLAIPEKAFERSLGWDLALPLTNILTFPAKHRNRGHTSHKPSAYAPPTS